jgi:hypothetical protein
MGLTLLTGSSISFSGLILLTVSLIPETTDSMFLVLLLISSSLALRKPGPLLANFLTLSHSI